MHACSRACALLQVFAVSVVFCQKEGAEAGGGEEKLPELIIALFLSLSSQEDFGCSLVMFSFQLVCLEQVSHQSSERNECSPVYMHERTSKREKNDDKEKRRERKKKRKVTRIRTHMHA